MSTRGFARTLYAFDGDYRVAYDGQFCASSTRMDSRGGKRHVETRVTFHAQPGKAESVDVDRIHDKELGRRTVDVPPCVHDVIAALARLRTAPPPGATSHLDISDGKKSASVKIVRHGPDKIETPAGKFDADRYEAFVFNNVIYRRKARLFVWLRGDSRRTPVQIRIEMPFYVGTVTFKLEKEQGS
jgi:hypothetical protein